VNDVVVWTEPNSGRFWRPQQGAPAAYEALLARCWDVLHALRPTVNVIAASAPHSKPAAWYRGLGAALRASGRMLPILDTVGHNAYPARSDERPDAVHRNGSLDEGDYAGLMQALHAAFDGTSQPVPGERGVTIWYMEDGFQTAVDPGRADEYRGVETDRHLSTDQGAQLAAAVREAYCQPAVGAFFNFQLADERDLGGWQSGVLWADGTPKPSYAQFRQAVWDVDLGAVACPGGPPGE